MLYLQVIDLSKFASHLLIKQNLLLELVKWQTVVLEHNYNELNEISVKNFKMYLININIEVQK